MSATHDWLSLVSYQGPDVPDSVRSIIAASDNLLRQKPSVEAATDELLKLVSDVTLTFYEHLRISRGAYSALLGRHFSFALRNNLPPEQCFAIFQRLSIVGFESPVEKCRSVVLLLQYLERHVASFDLTPLVNTMAAELEVCREGCEENLSVLETFRNGAQL